MNNIYTFFGADNGVGCTMIAQSVAAALAVGDKTSVLVGCSGYDGLDYIIKPEAFQTIDSLRNSLQNTIISDTEIDNSLISIKDGFSILAGVTNRLEIRFYHPEDIKYLCNNLSQRFDYVILDAGANPITGLFMGAMDCGKKYLVATPQEKTIQRYLNDKHIFQAKEYEYELIINKYMESAKVYTVDQINKIVGAQAISLLPLSDYGWQAETDHVLLTTLSKGFRDNINDLCNIITGSDAIKTKKRLFRRWIKE